MSGVRRSLVKASVMALAVAGAPFLIRYAHSLFGPHTMWSGLVLFFVSGLFWWPGYLAVRLVPGHIGLVAVLVLMFLVNWLLWGLLFFGVLEWLRKRREVEA